MLRSEQLPLITTAGQQNLKCPFRAEARAHTKWHLPLIMHNSQLPLFLQEQAEELLSSFEAPLKEFVRLVKSAKNVMADRSSALQAMHQVSRACPSGH